MNILAISGSLRRASHNSALLRAAQELAPKETTWKVAAIGDLPLYNSDLEDPAALAPVERFQRELAAADAVIIATPEYNYGVPGPLKNAIDWGSRPAYQSPFRDKPVAVAGTAMGTVGSARAQGQLKQVLLGMAAQVFPYPEFLVTFSKTKVDDSGALTDSGTREFLTKFVGDFVAWARKVK